MVAPSSSNWSVLKTPCWVPLRFLLHSTDGLLKLTFSTGILSCCRDQLRHFNSVNSSLTYVFHLADFMDISYLTHLTIASLVTFAELCILLCYEVFVLKFR